jgi:Tfp pilus assembly protein PilO
MEKNIRKRVCRLAFVLSAVLVVLFGYWFFLNPHGYWQKKKEAEKEEYSERRMLLLTS